MTKSGVACKIEDTVDRGTNEIAITIKTAPNISDTVRIITVLFLKMSFVNIGMSLTLAMMKNKTPAKIPIYIKICEAGMNADNIFMKRSSIANPAIDNVI